MSGVYAFVTDQGARYNARAIECSEAIDHGCPSANVELEGRHGKMYVVVGIRGHVKRRVPKCGGEQGYRAQFHLPVFPGDGNEVIVGWALFRV